MIIIPKNKLNKELKPRYGSIKNLAPDRYTTPFKGTINIFLGIKRGRRKIKKEEHIPIKKEKILAK